MDAIDQQEVNYTYYTQQCFAWFLILSDKHQYLKGCAITTMSAAILGQHAVCISGIMSKARLSGKGMKLNIYTPRANL